MAVTIIINTKNETKEDIRSFLRAIREWELRAPKVEVTGIVTSLQDKAIFDGIFPEFKDQMVVPDVQGGLLRLGDRGVTVGGKLIGTCSELMLSIGQATDEEIDQLEQADTITLVKIKRG